MIKRVIVGARGSKLAQIQAQSVIRALTTLYPTIEFILTGITTHGDRLPSAPIERIQSRGVFVKELEEALLDGRIDLAVHSLKDMPFQIPDGLSLAAVTERADSRDVLITRGAKLAELKPGSVIGTGSPRRIVQLHSLRPDLKVKGIRGNVDTRLRKVAGGEYDGIMVAAAGMLRLGLEARITEYLPVERFLPRAGQGALGIEVKAGSEAEKLVRPLNHTATRQCVTAERAFEQAMGGGCSAAVGCLGSVDGNILRLRGMAVGRDGVYYSAEEGQAQNPDIIGRGLAQKLRAMGASGIAADIDL